MNIGLMNIAYKYLLSVDPDAASKAAKLMIYGFCLPFWILLIIFWLPAIIVQWKAFARKYGYEEYMPYLCNLDYVMFGVMGAPLYREHTCFEDGDYCDFKLKCGAEILPYWPPVFRQDNPYK